MCRVLHFADERVLGRRQPRLPHLCSGTVLVSGLVHSLWTMSWQSMHLKLHWGSRIQVGQSLASDKKQPLRCLELFAVCPASPGVGSSSQSSVCPVLLTELHTVARHTAHGKEAAFKTRIESAVSTLRFSIQRNILYGIAREMQEPLHAASSISCPSRS